MLGTRIIALASLTVVSLAAAAYARAEVRTFERPMQQGLALGYCDSTGEECGMPVAAAWCVAQGYEYASGWSLLPQAAGLMTRAIDGGASSCRGEQCLGFATITCGREDRAYRLPTLGGLARNTVIAPNRRETVAEITAVEYRVLVPRCEQREPGDLLCETVPDFQHCRGLLRAGHVRRCRAGLAFDGAFASASAAAPDTYALELKSNASMTVVEGERGSGRIKGDARFEIAFAVPSTANGRRCLQRDRYLYHPDGPEGGLATIDATADCDQPLAGRFAPHEDDLLRAYDACRARDAWGERLSLDFERLVAALFHMSAGPWSEAAVHIEAPYVVLEAPLEVRCKASK